MSKSHESIRGIQTSRESGTKTFVQQLLIRCEKLFQRRLSLSSKDDMTHFCLPHSKLESLEFRFRKRTSTRLRAALLLYQRPLLLCGRDIRCNFGITAAVQRPYASPHAHSGKSEKLVVGLLLTVVVLRKIHRGIRWAFVCELFSIAWFCGGRSKTETLHDDTR